MEPERALLRKVILDKGKFVITLHREDLSPLYPGMAKYDLAVISEGRILDRFRTNTCEYSVPESIAAETVALHKADEWEDEIRTSPAVSG